MLYRSLGKTGIDLSILGFGCMRLPLIDNKPEKIDYEKSKELIHYAIDHGVNFVDTAYFYHAAVFGERGESEPFVGKALSGGWRKKVHLATKLPLFLVNERAQMDTFLDEQMESLKTDYLDFYLLHGLNGESWDRVYNLGVLDFLDKARKDGRIRFPAFSFHGTLKDFKRIIDAYDWVYAQIQYNYMDIDFQAGTKGLKYAEEKGISVVVMEPLKGGKLAANFPKEMTEAFESASVKRSPVEWALRFVWNETGVVSLLSGMNGMEQVKENLALSEKWTAGNLKEDDLKMYDKLRTVMKSKIKADCTACRYCMPCNSGVDIPEVLAALNNAEMWGDANPFATGYFQVKGKASACTDCGECAKVCPQGLPIPDLMKEAVKIFGE